MQKISIIPSHQINRSKWNECIQQSVNGMIYATTTYLDFMSDNWTGIVYNDYAAVMPVPWRKKYGIRYAYNVPFIQQLGFFSTLQSISPDQMVSALFTICRYGDYSFNYFHATDGALKRTNCVLRIESGMENKFSENTIKNIKRSQEQGLIYQEGTIEEAVEVYQQLYGQRFNHIKNNSFEQFKKLCKEFKKEGNTVVRKVIGKQAGLQAIVLLLRDKKRLYNIMPSTTPEGRAGSAMYLLLSALFTEFIDSGLLFDFEGSDLPGVQEFNKKFGPVDQPYYQLHFNKLPWPVNLFTPTSPSFL